MCPQHSSLHLPLPTLSCQGCICLDSWANVSEQVDIWDLVLAGDGYLASPKMGIPECKTTFHLTSLLHHAVNNSESIKHIIRLYILRSNGSMGYTSSTLFPIIFVHLRTKDPWGIYCDFSWWVWVFEALQTLDCDVAEARVLGLGLEDWMWMTLRWIKSRLGVLTL